MQALSQGATPELLVVERLLQELVDLARTQAATAGLLVLYHAQLLLERRDEWALLREEP